MVGAGSRFAIGKGSVWNTAVTPTRQLTFTKEDLIYEPNLKSEEGMIGYPYDGAAQIMNVKASGPFDMYAKPDEIGLILFCAFGTQAATVAQAPVAEITEMTVPSGITGGDYFYFNSVTTAYIGYFTIGGVGSDPAITGYTSVLFACPTAATAAQAASVMSAAIHALATFNATVSGAVVTVTNTATGAIATAPTDYNSGVTFEIIQKGYGLATASTSSYTHAFTPLPIGVSESLPHLTVMVDRKHRVFRVPSYKINELSIDMSPNEFVKMTINGVGNDVDSAAFPSLTPSTLKPFKFRGAEVRYDGYLYDNVTKIMFTHKNQLEVDLYTANGLSTMREPEPLMRETRASIEMLYDADSEGLWQNNFKVGDPVSLRIYLQSEETTETGYYYFLKIEIPIGYIMTDPKPSMTSRDRIRCTLDIKAAQTSATAAVTVSLGDKQATDY